MTKQKIIIPRGWESVKIRDIADVKNGKSNTQDAISDGKYLFFDRSALIKRSSKYLFDAEAIILPGEGAEFLPRYYKGKFDLHQRAYSIISKNQKTNTRYLFYFLFAKRNVFVKKSVGSTVKSLRLPMIQSFSIVLPPLPEQTKIAEILSKVDEDIEKTERVIKNAEKLKRGLMQELFTKGIGHKKFKKTKLGEIPEEWDVVKLGDIGSNFIGLTYSPKNVVASGGTLVFRSSNIKNGAIVYNDNVYVNSKISNNLITKKGDILLCTRNGSRDLIGKCVYITDDSAGHSFGAFMSVYRTKYSEFIFQVFLSDIFKEQVKKYLGATINQITNTSLNSFIVPFPQVREQKQIAEILSSVDDKIEINKQIKNKLTQLKKGLMQDLLSGRVRI